MIRRAFMALILLVGGTLAASTLLATPVSAQQKDCGGYILTLPPWYRGLTDTNCQIISPEELANGDSSKGLEVFVWRVVINIVEMLLQLIGYIAVGFIIYGGFQLMTSAGAPEQAEAARKTVMNAAIGVAIAIISIGLVNLVAAGVGI